MAPVTQDQCEQRVGTLHTKLDKILDNQLEHRERLARVEEKVKNSSGIIAHIITGISAAAAAFFGSKFTQ